MVYGWIDKTLKCLRKNPKQQFTAREIAEWVVENYKEECEVLRSRSSRIKTNKDLLNHVTSRIIGYTPRLLKENFSSVKVTEDRPRKYHYTESSDGDEAGHSQDIASDPAKVVATSSAAANLNNKTLECLRKNPKQKFTAHEIAKWIFKNYREECEVVRGRSSKIKTNKDLLNRITFKINAYTKHLLKENSSVKVTEDRPRKYYLAESSNGGEIDQSDKALIVTAIVAAKQAKRNDTEKNPIKEKDLYPVLIKFLWSALKIYSKRIDERRSSNSSGARANKWLYPDIVALRNLSEDWHREIKDCVREYSDKKTRLWSFEVKKKISRSNVRECYFQAVSNSSWANFGYLAAGEIRADALGELRILAGLLGIGLIKLNIEHPSESQIVIPAKERPGVDWNTANRLAKENKDFLNCIKSVREFYQTGRVDPASWDTKKYIAK